MDKLNYMFNRLKHKVIGNVDSTQPLEKCHKGDKTGSADDDIDHDFVLIEREELRVGNINSPLCFGKPYTYAASSQGDGTGCSLPNRDLSSFAGGFGHPLLPGSVSLSLDVDNHLLHSNHQSPITGVLFELHPSLQARSHLQKLFTDLDMDVERFDWPKYSYDFEFEQTALRELADVGGEGKTTARYLGKR